MQRSVLPLIAMSFLVLFLAVALFRPSSHHDSALIGKPIPKFAGTLLLKPDQTFTRQELIGHVAVINVWATWCPNCRREHAVLMKYASRFPLYGLNWLDDEVKARQWLQALGNPYNVIISDDDGTIGIDLGVSGAPETFVIDAAGIVREKYVGPLSDEQVENELLPLIRSLTAGASS